MTLNIVPVFCIDIMSISIVFVDIKIRTENRFGGRGVKNCMMRPKNRHTSILKSNQLARSLIAEWLTMKNLLDRENTNDIRGERASEREREINI
jgi:hypothetical protein